MLNYFVSRFIGMYVSSSAAYKPWITQRESAMKDEGNENPDKMFLKLELFREKQKPGWRQKRPSVLVPGALAGSARAGGRAVILDLPPMCFGTLGRSLPISGLHSPLVLWRFYVTSQQQHSDICG